VRFPNTWIYQVPSQEGSTVLKAEEGGKKGDGKTGVLECRGTGQMAGRGERTGKKSAGPKGLNKRYNRVQNSTCLMKEEPMKIVLEKGRDTGWENRTVFIPFKNGKQRGT